MEKTSIAIIGAGPAGLVALKNLREQGFDASIFERRPSVGGLWSYSENPEYTTALDDTTVNVSKFVSSFSDFPMPDHYPDFPSRRQIQEYFEAYVNHFDLQRYIRFGITVHKVLRNSPDSGWDVHFTDPNNGESVLPFHKVVFANGCETISVWPSMQRREEFKGTVMHAQEYRDYKKHDLQGKRVMVVGIGNTGCEIALNLCKHASKTYLAYRRGRILVSRYDGKGIPMDSQIPWPILCLTYILSYYIPRIMKWLVDKIMINKMIHDAANHGPNREDTSKKQRLREAEKRVREDWCLVPCPSMAHRNPAVQEDIFPAFYNNDITPVQGFVDFASAKTVLLADHTAVEVDVVIFATGYRHGFSIMPELEMDGAAGVELKTARKTEQHVSEDKTPQPALPRLFQMMFPPKHASSVAFLSWMAPQENVWCICELASMVIAQAWVADCTRRREPQSLQPPSLLPSEKVMEDEVDSYHTWWRGEWATDRSILHGCVRPYGFYRFLHKTAGTGLDVYLDKYVILKGLRLYKDDYELWKWLHKGPTTSFAWRLFDTNPESVPGHGRKVWEGARDALRKNYEEFERFQKAKAKND